MFFFFNDTATTEIYTLSLHDALPICHDGEKGIGDVPGEHDVLLNLVELLRLDGDEWVLLRVDHALRQGEIKDRKSTRLNSSHANISYAVFCLKKKKLENSKRQMYAID